MSDTVRTILVLAANPINQARLRLDEEVREIDEGLRRSKHREYFKLEQKWAVDTDSLRRALLDFEPHIVHFCGHGYGDEGLILEDKTGYAKPVSTEALATLFELCKEHIECVVLNACYSEKQANTIVQHIGYVIGMSETIGDKAAVKFTIGFYDALSAGRTVESAYRFGCNAIQMESIPEYLIPTLKKNTNAAKDYLRNSVIKNKSNSISGTINLVNLVAIIHIGYGIFNAIYLPITLLSTLPLALSMSGAMITIFGSILVVFIYALIIKSGMLMQRRKNRMFSVKIGLFLLMGFPLGTIIGGLTLYSLFREETIEEYQSSP